MVHKVEVEIGTERLVLETGRLARQADGAVLAQSGETMVLAATVEASSSKRWTVILPLTR